METIWPNDNGTSVIPPDQLQKEIQKGTIRPRPQKTKGGDEDMDEYVDEVVNEIYQHYDPKGVGQIKKSVLKKFFNDALEIYALRQGRKSAKEVIAPNVKKDQAMSESIAKVLSNPQAEFCSKKEFEDFLNCYDLDEALGSFLGKSEFAVNNNIQFVDTSAFKEQADAPKKVQYRDRSNFEE